MRPRGFNQSFWQGQFHEQPHHGNHDGLADRFGHDKCPAQQQPENEPKS